jgi:CHAD domain-containing protein
VDVTAALPADRLLLARLAGAQHDQWQELLQQRQLVLDSCDHEAIHDLRVASRRLRTVTELLAPLIGTEQVRRLQRPLRRLTRELGQLRNLDEAHRYLTGLNHDGLAPLTSQLAQQRRHECTRIRPLLKGLPKKRLQRLLERSGQQLNGAEAAPPLTVVGRLEERNLALYRPIHQLLQLPELAEQADQRHTLRIAIKKWRYFSELLALLWGRRQDRLTILLKRYQGLLGELNDRELLLTLVRDAEQLAPPVRDRVLLLIDAQHRQLINDFRQLLAQQPLQYQFQV